MTGTPDTLTDRLRHQLAVARARRDHIATLSLETSLCAICPSRQPVACACRRVERVA